eukprot:gene17139-23443_t
MSKEPDAQEGMEGSEDYEIVDEPYDPTGVDDKYKFEYSEETRDRLKSMNNPPWQETDESLDPIEDMQAYQEFDYKYPPATYEKLVDASKSQIAELEALREARLPEDYEEVVRYRKELVSGTAAEEIKWLKLRAYHRGQAILRAREAAASKPESVQATLDEYQVPVDVVPAELLDLSPAEIAHKHASNQRKSLPQASSLPYSEDSEWDPEWQATSHLTPSLALSFAQLLREQLYPAAPQAVEEVDPEMTWEKWAAEGRAWPAEMVATRAYTPEFIDSLRNEIKMRKQQRLKRRAFLVPLVTITVVHLWKLWRNRVRNGKKKPRTKQAMQ